MSLEALSNIASLQEPIFHGSENGSESKSCSSGSENSIIRPLAGHSMINNDNISPPPLNRQQSTESNVPMIPTLSRQNSQGSSVRVLDWARQVTLEERKFIREKIKNAYRRKVSTYEDLLEACSAIEEELVFGIAPSRLDYFKSGVQFEKRVAEKLTQIRSGVIIGLSCTDKSNDESERTVKRTKTQL